MDMLQFAINMELDGERYYREQAERNADNALKTVFDILAEDEAKHASILRNRMDGKAYELKPHEGLTSEMNLFSNENDYHAQVEEKPEQVEVYHTAIAKEQQSIDLYTELRAKANNAETQALFDFLIKEETTHFTILTEMYHHVNRPNEWVEAAEFGVREEY